MSTTNARTGIAVALLVWVATCGEQTPTADAPETAARLQIVAGTDQNGAVGAPLPAPLAVRVTDAHGRLVPGVVVGWTAQDGSMHLINAATDGSGIARSVWTLSTRPGAQQARAFLNTADSAVFFSATAEPGPAVHAQITPDFAGVIQGDSVPLRLEAHDIYDNGIPRNRIRWFSSDSSIVRVTERGVVYGLALGEVWIVVEVDSQRDTARVAVYQPAGG